MPPQSLAPELDPNDEIQFVANHRVSLTAGDYEVTASQAIKPSQSSDDKFTFTCSQKFSVLAEQFELNPQTIHAEFPPGGSRGDFQADLPHVILNRSTLPWERTAKSGGSEPEKDPPWLGLLLFHQDEVQLKHCKASTVKLSELVSGPEKVSPFFPKVKLETWEDVNQQVRVVDVKWSVLKDILPVDLDYHVHARRRLAWLKLTTDDNIYPPDSGGAKDVLKAAAVELSASAICSEVPQEQSENQKQRWHFRDMAQRAEYEVWYDKAAKSWRAYQLDVETAFLLGNRLPQPGQRNLVHLVSLEGRYQGSQEPYQFDYQGATDDQLVRLVSLYSWEFFCESPAHTFKGLLEGLNRTSVDVVAGKLRLIIAEGASARIENAKIDVVNRTVDSPVDGKVATITSGDWTGATHVSTGVVDNERNLVTYDVLDKDHQPLVNLNGTIHVNGLEASSDFGLPSSAANNNEDAGKLLRAGLIPLRHSFREGSRSVSWYHGPLVPSTPFEPTGKDASDSVSDSPAIFPVLKMSADQLLTYDPATGMFDAGYAAAWELGRMLTLQNRNVALSLFHWKRQVAQSRVHQARDKRRPTAPQPTGLALEALYFLQGVRAAPGQKLLPDDVTNWLAELCQLLHLPFAYLVPDERMLPPESIRFFHIDPRWLQCLCDGACSPGGKPENTCFPAIQARSGILLRSEVVSGWPGLCVDGYGMPDQSDLQANPKKLKLLRMERLSQNVLLCLFDGDLKELDIRLRSETMHFGFNKTGAGLVKTLRDGEGKLTEEQFSVEKYWLNRERRTLNFNGKNGLPKKMANGSVATFALQMVASIDIVRFTR